VRKTRTNNTAGRQKKKKQNRAPMPAAIKKKSKEQGTGNREEWENEGCRPAKWPGEMGHPGWRLWKISTSLKWAPIELTETSFPAQRGTKQGTSKAFGKRNLYHPGGTTKKQNLKGCTALKKLPGPPTVENCAKARLQ